MMRLYLAVAMGVLLSCSTALAAPCSSEDGGAGGFSGQCSVEPNNFIQTINAMRLLRDNGDSTYTFVEMTASPAAYDFASVSAGGALGNLLAGADVPDGTYVAMSPILDRMATLNASTSVDGMPCRTASGGVSTDGGTPEDYTFDFTVGSPFSSGTDAAYDFGTAANEQQYLNPDGDLVIVKKFPSPFIVSTTSTANMTINMAFDAAEAGTFSFDGTSCTDAFLGMLNATIGISTN